MKHIRNFAWGFSIGVLAIGVLVAVLGPPALVTYFSDRLSPLQILCGYALWICYLLGLASTVSGREDEDIQDKK